MTVSAMVQDDGMSAKEAAKEKDCDVVKTPDLKLLDTQTERGGETGIRFWIVDGEPYDFSEFAPKHPGGDMWFQMNSRRDISVLFHTCHLDPKKIMPILHKYKITKDHPNYDFCTRENLLPKMGVPPFLLSKDFDGRNDVQEFDFQNETHLLNVLRKTVKTDAFQKKIKTANFWFDRCCDALLALYGALTAGFLFDAFYIPNWLAITAYVVLRTAFAACGHYYLHAKKPNTMQGLFDMNYVGTSFTGVDGHVMLHHAYTHTGADVKTNFFGGIWAVPQLYRPLAYTVHKLGGALIGCMLRFSEIGASEKMFVGADKDQLSPHHGAPPHGAPPHRAPPHHHQAAQAAATDAADRSLSGPPPPPPHMHPPLPAPFRLLITAEFYLAFRYGKIVPFIVQFIITLWFNSFLVLSSHDFEDFYADPMGGYNEDWGVFQINNCHDMILFGNKFIDIFMSAGLSSHRAHHLFPYQPSGFANIATEDLIAKVLPDYGLTWDKPKVFWWDRAPYVFQFCFLHPTTDMEDMPFWRQHLSFSGLFSAAKFMGTGFLGINSI